MPVKKYEVPGQQWADLTSADGSYGVAVINDCKYGWDHPDGSTLRMSLIHTPGISKGWEWVGDQKSQDLGTHHFTYAILGTSGSWQEALIPWQAADLNQPLPFRSPNGDPSTETALFFDPARRSGAPQ